VLVGNRKLMRDNGVNPSPAMETMERLEHKGKTVMGIAADADTVKESAKEAVSALWERSVDVICCSRGTFDLPVKGGRVIRVGVELRISDRISAI